MSDFISRMVENTLGSSPRILPANLNIIFSHQYESTALEAQSELDTHSLETGERDYVVSPLVSQNEFDQSFPYPEQQKPVINQEKLNVPIFSSESNDLSTDKRIYSKNEEVQKETTESLITPSKPTQFNKVLSKQNNNELQQKETTESLITPSKPTHFNKALANQNDDKLQQQEVAKESFQLDNFVPLVTSTEASRRELNNKETKQLNSPDIVEQTEKKRSGVQTSDEPLTNKNNNEIQQVILPQKPFHLDKFVPLVKSSEEMPIAPIVNENYGIKIKEGENLNQRLNSNDTINEQNKKDKNSNNIIKETLEESFDLKLKSQQYSESNVLNQTDKENSVQNKIKEDQAVKSAIKNKPITTGKQVSLSTLKYQNKKAELDFNKIHRLSNKGSMSKNVEINIGRIEVTSNQAKQQSMPAVENYQALRPSLSLTDYLKQQNR